MTVEQALDALGATVEELRAAMSRRNGGPGPDGARLLLDAAELIGVPVEDVRGASRQPLLLERRMVIVAVLRMAAVSHRAIGDLFRRREPTIRVWEDRVQDDRRLWAAAIRLGARLGVASEIDATRAARQARRR